MTDHPASGMARMAAANAEENVSDTGENSSPQNDSEDNALMLIIFGETQTGKKFRPSDWCERLYGVLRVLGDEAKEVTEYVHLVNHDGQKCILIDSRLECFHPKVYSFFTRFAKDNNLAVQTLSWQEWNAQHG